MPLDQANWQLTLLAADKTANAFRSVDQNIRRIDTQAKATTSAMSTGFAAVGRALIPLAAAFSAAALAQRAWHAGMKAADLGEQAEQIGLTTDQLQAYRLVAAQSGVSAEQLDAAMMKLTRSMGTANEGSDEMIARFDRLGVKLLDGEGKLRKTSDVMPEVARGLLRISSESERASLMQELFGRSGTRLVTILSALAEGNDRVVQSAKDQNAVLGSEAIAAWDKLADQLKVVEQQANTLWAQLGAPIATHGLAVFNSTLKELNALLQAGKAAGKWLFGGGITGNDAAGLKKRAETIQATIDAMSSGAAGEMDDLAKARLSGLYKQLEDVNNQIAQQMTAAYTLPPVVVTATRDGDSNPTGDKARKAGEDLNKKRLEESKKAYAELLAELEKVRKAGEALDDRFGSGKGTLARGMDELNQLYEQGAIDIGVYNLALQDLVFKTDDMQRAYIGAQGGFEGFVAGFEQGMADMERANSAFEIGKRMVDELSQAITDLATGAEVDFNRILVSFINMLSQMAMQQAMSAAGDLLGPIFKGLIGGIAGGIGGGISPISPGAAMSAYGSMPASFTMPGFAAGGRPPTGVPYLVGENGPELRVDDMPGRIFNRDQLGAMDGGGSTVVVQQTIHVGEFVTTSEFRSGLRAMGESAREGAIAGVMERRQRSGPIKKIFKR